jgi:hypothetical protein
MRAIPRLTVCVALALMPLLTTVRSFAQHKGQPEELKLAMLNRKPLKAAEKDSELKKLLIARYNEHLAQLLEVNDLVQRGAKPPDILMYPGAQFVQASLELMDKPADRIAIITEYVELAKVSERVFEAQHQAGLAVEADLHHARYLRIDAEIQLLRAKRMAEKPRDK